MIETDLYAYLAAYSGLTALVGTKIFPIVAPQGTARPCVVFLKVANDRKYTHTGFAGLSETRVQVSCYADAYETDGATVGALAIAAQVTAAMEAWPGAAGIQAVFADGERHIYEEETDVHHIPLDFIVWHGN